MFGINCLSIAVCCLFFTGTMNVATARCALERGDPWVSTLLMGLLFYVLGTVNTVSLVMQIVREANQ